MQKTWLTEVSETFETCLGFSHINFNGVKMTWIPLNHPLTGFYRGNIYVRAENLLEGMSIN